MEDNKFSSRKFILATFVILVSIPLLYFKMIDQGTYLSLTGSALALYFTGNVAQKIAG